MGTIRCSLCRRLFRLADYGWLAAALLSASTSVASSALDAPRPISIKTEASPPRTTAALYALCRSGPDKEEKWCEGYLAGFADVLVALGNSRIPGGICNAEYYPSTLRTIFETW